MQESLPLASLGKREKREGLWIQCLGRSHEAILEGSPVEQRWKLRHKEGAKDWDWARTHAKSSGGLPVEQVAQQGRLGRYY